MLSSYSPLDRYAIWGSIVETFSKGGLTYEKDKLVAISGIAARMQPAFDDTYLAGLWSRHLGSELMWVCEGGTRSTQYIAPSWSWASVNHAVRSVSSVCHNDERDLLIQVVSAHVELVSDANPFGQVTAGTIRLRGHLAKPRLAFSKENHRTTHILADENIDTFVVVDSDVALSVLRTEGLDWAVELYCLPVREASEVHKETSLEGLLLEQTETPGEFRRFGSFAVLVDEEVEAFLRGDRVV